MSKLHKLLFLIILIFLIIPSASGDFELTLSSSDTAEDALKTLPENTGSLTLRLGAEFTGSEIFIPADRGITDVILTPENEGKTTALPGVTRICANGIPLTVAEGLDLENASLYGGSCVSGEKYDLESSSLTIFGKIGFVFGGGFSEDGGSSYVGDTSVTLKKNGTVYYEVFGGGHAYGEGSISKTGSTQVLIEGTADYVLGGGFAEDGGTAECTQTLVTVSENAEIPVALFSGGSASGKDSISAIENAAALLDGRANWAFSGDFAFSEGETRLSRASLLQIGPSGTAEIAYLGSFSSDDGSYAFVNTAELQNCGTVEQIVQNSQTTDGGRAETLIRSLLTCEEP